MARQGNFSKSFQKLCAFFCIDGETLKKCNEENI